MRNKKKKEEDKQSLRINILETIKANPESFPFIAQFWDIKVKDRNTGTPECLEYGNHDSYLETSSPFYKPISKIIDLNKLEDL